MAQNTILTISAGTMTLITDSDVSALRVQNQGSGGKAVYLVAQNGTGSTPSVDDGGLILEGGETLAANITLADLFPGVTSPNRVYAYAGSGATLSVSHA